MKRITLRQAVELMKEKGYEITCGADAERNLSDFLDYYDCCYAPNLIIPEESPYERPITRDARMLDFFLDDMTDIFD